MNTQNKRLVLITIFSLLLVIACGVSTTTTIPNVPGAPETMAERTLIVMRTSAALSASPTSSPAPPTVTPTPSETPTITNTPTASRTQIPALTAIPTNTPQPTNTATFVPTVTPWISGGGGGGGGGGGSGGGGGGEGTPCLAARLVRHVTIPNGQFLPRSRSFVKVWRIQNTGSCIWNSDIIFTPVGRFDPLFGAPIRVSERVRPGDTIDMAVSLLTPNSDGNFTGEWIFDTGDEEFGNNGSEPFRVNVNVSDSPPSTKYDFASRICAAQYQSNARLVRNNIRIENNLVTNLPCEGRSGNPVGFVRLQNTPNMESGEIVDFQGLWTNPPRANGGIIQGFFPAMIVFSGDRFVSQIGCRSGADNCNVTFELKYRVITPPNNRVSEDSVFYDKQYTGSLINIDIDLGSLGLSGQYVSFIFRVRANNNSDENESVWVGPRIVH